MHQLSTLTGKKFCRKWYLGSMSYFLVKKAAPVLNAPDFKAVFHNPMPLSEQGHPYQYEFVALPGMVFKVARLLNDTIAEIHWPEYSSQALFTDRRFGSLVETPLPPEKKPLYAKTILETMERRIGVPYVWGGNWANGIPEMLDYYPPSQALSPRMKDLWTFRGLDCSGLLFEASMGATPRNTSQLVTFGRPVTLNDLQPLDMIVYPGHVLFVRDAKTSIESRSPYGVVIAPLEERLREILQTRAVVETWVSGTDPSRFFTLRRFAV